MLRILLLCSLLAGCADQQILRGSGEVAPTPAGYTIGCANNPDAVACPK